MATSLMNFRVTPEEREAINAAAASRGVSASELIRTALKTMLWAEDATNRYFNIVTETVQILKDDGPPRKAPANYIADITKPRAVVGGLLEKEETE